MDYRGCEIIEVVRIITGPAFQLIGRSRRRSLNGSKSSQGGAGDRDRANQTVRAVMEIFEDVNCCGSRDEQTGVRSPPSCCRPSNRPMTRVALSLGANLGDRLRPFSITVDVLSGLGEIVGLSDVYRPILQGAGAPGITTPWSSLETDASAQQVLAATHRANFLGQDAPARSAGVRAPPVSTCWLW